MNPIPFSEAPIAIGFWVGEFLGGEAREVCFRVSYVIPMMIANEIHLLTLPIVIEAGVPLIIKFEISARL